MFVSIESVEYRADPKTSFGRGAVTQEEIGVLPTHQAAMYVQPPRSVPGEVFE